MAEGDIGAVIDTGIFDAVRGIDPSVVHVSGNVFAIAYQGVGDDGWLCTFTIDNLGNIGAIIDTLEFEGADCRLPCMIHVSGNIYAIAYWQSALDDGIIVTVDIDNAGNIGAAVIDTLTFDAVRGRIPDIIHISGDIFAIAYRGPDDDGWLCTFNIDNLGNIGAAAIDTLEFNGSFGSAPSILHISGDIYAIAYTGPDDDGWLCTFNIDNLGNIGAAVIDTLEFDNTWSNDQRIIHVSGDIFAIAYRRWTNPGRLCTVNIDNLGNIGAIIDTLEFEPVTGIRISVVHISGNVFAFAYQGPDSDGWLKTLSVADDGTIGAVIDSLEFDPAYCDYPHIIYVSGDIYAIAYTSALFGPGSIKTVDIETIVLPTVTTDPATGISAILATLNGTLNDDGGEACACGFKWGLTPAYGHITPTQSRTTGLTFAQTIIGLDPNKTYHFIAFATNGAGTSYGADRTFKTLVALPAAATDPATGVVDNSASLNGTLSNDGGEACACGFEWGSTPAYGNTTPTQSRIIGQTFAQTVDPLNPNTTYYFRAFATNSVGTSYGAQRSFTTLQIPYYASLILPNVQTNPATLVTEHAARLNGIIIEDGGNSGDTRFQWGLTTNYGNITPWQQGFGKGDTFFVDLNNLAEGTAFHFRAQMRNQGGVVSGNDMAFNTLSPLGPVTLIDDELIYLLEAV